MENKEYDRQLQLFREADRQLYYIIYSTYLPCFIDSAVHKKWCCDCTADEAYHQAVTELWERVASNIDFRLTCCLSTYLYAAARCNILDIKKHNRFYVELEFALHKASVDISPEDTTDIKLRKTYLLTLLEELSADEKQIIDLYYFRELPWKTIAEIMHNKVANLKEKKCWILKKLRKMINENKRMTSG